MSNTFLLATPTVFFLLDYDNIQRIQVECLTVSVVAFVVMVELICIARQNDRRC